MVRQLERLMSGRVDQVTTDAAGNLLVRHGHGPRALTFLGHVDTVPGEVEVEQREGALYGRGSVDAKGPLCAALAALARLPEAARERLTVRVVGAVGEEAPGSVGARHAVETLPKPELLVICEPSGWDAVTLGYKGHLRLRLEVSRPSGHAAGPEPSAADRLVSSLAALRASCSALNDPGAAAFDTLQTTVLSLDHAHDGLEERASAVVGVRLPPLWPAERLEESLGDEWRAEGVTVAQEESICAVRGERDSVLARAFRTAIRASGGRPRSVVKTGTSDWNVVAPVWDVPTLAYGPGDARLDHAPNEHLELAEYDAAVEVVLAVLKRHSLEAERHSPDNL